MSNACIGHHGHRWGRWRQGRHSGLWFRTCPACMAQERAESQPADEPPTAPPGIIDVDQDPLLAIRGKLERLANINRPDFRKRASEPGDAA